MAQLHRHPDPDQFHQILRVPVGQPETAVRFRAPDLLRSRRAVHAVAGFVQADPRHADRIVRTRRQNPAVAERLQFRRFGKQLRVHGVVGMGRDDAHVQFTHRAFLHMRRDAAREMREQIGVRVKGLQEFSRQMDDDERRLAVRLRIRHVGNLQTRFRRHVRPVHAGV